jgi:hypothetical protein
MESRHVFAYCQKITDTFMEGLLRYIIFIRQSKRLLKAFVRQSHSSSPVDVPLRISVVLAVALLLFLVVFSGFKVYSQFFSAE